MVAGLSPLEVGLLRLSVGYGGHKTGRPLSPIEVGQLIGRLRRSGLSLEACARFVRLSETNVKRFLSIIELPEDLQHVVAWGARKGTVGFSCAVELARFSAADEQRVVAEAILADGLDKGEVRQVRQLRVRSGRCISACVREVMGMRTVVEKRYVFIGSVSDHDIGRMLGALTQRERDAVLRSGIEALDLPVTAGRLGRRFFTLVGEESFDATMKDIGKGNLEARLRTHIGEALRNA